MSVRGISQCSKWYGDRRLATAQLGLRQKEGLRTGFDQPVLERLRAWNRSI
jgi:hypothetical protein